MPTTRPPARDPLTSPLTFRDDLLKDQVVLVSGAGSGIGKAIAIQCARLGAKLAICGRKVEKLEETAAILRDIGAEVFVRPATIRDAEDVDRLHAEVWERFGRLDHLVNNAGGQ
ncbi:MAG: SDR family NAD(P)-dependent oxidoreductase, partial [Ferrovibrio sp.]